MNLRVMISSVRCGLADAQDAAVPVLTILGYEPLRFEDGDRPASPAPRRVRRAGQPSRHLPAAAQRALWRSDAGHRALCRKYFPAAEVLESEYQHTTMGRRGDETRSVSEVVIVPLKTRHCRLPTNAVQQSLAAGRDVSDGIDTSVEWTTNEVTQHTGHTACQ